MRARITHYFYAAIGLLLSSSVLISSPALAQAKACCNLETKEFTTDSLDVCTAKPNHVHIGKNGENMAQALLCFQNTQNQATQYLQQMGGMPSMPAIPGMPPGATLPNVGPNSGQMTPMETAAPQYDCCNKGDGQFIGAMSVENCLAETDHYPDTPEYLTQVDICRPEQPGGGAWNVDDFEDNIPNGGMENWDDENTPHGFSSFGIPPAAKAQAQGFDMQTVFKSSDAHTGNASAELKNFDMGEAIKKMGAPALVDLSGMATPAGVTSCKDPCPLKTLGGAGNASILQTVLPISEAKANVCAAYKGYISPMDQLTFSVALARGSQIVGGTDLGSSGEATFTQSSGEWVTISMPINLKSGNLNAANGISVSAQVQPRGMMQQVQATGIPGRVSNHTRVKIDSIHLCEPDMLTIYKPKVIGISENKAIVDKDEEDKGAQTFVNYDNDDKDKYFDFEDKDGVTDDDELVRLKLTLPEKSDGMVEIKVDGVNDKIQLWDDKNKKTKFEFHNKQVDFDKVFTEPANKGKFKKEIWIEALKPSKRAKDIEIEFIFKPRGASNAKLTDTVTLTALGIADIEFIGKGNSVDDGDKLDEDKQVPTWMKDKVYRVFPGKRLPGDGEKKDIVDVKVTLNVKPVRPVEFVFRAFDVDDPSAFDDEVDDETKAEDNRGKTPHVWGGFPADSKAYLRVEFKDKTETFEFQTTMQPGDNFRIVGNGDFVTLMELENDDSKLADYSKLHPFFIVDPNILAIEKNPEKAQIPQHEEYVSDILTVWRKMYLEIDTMGPVKDNTLIGIIEDYKDLGLASNGGIKFKLKLDKNIYANLPEESKSGIKGVKDSYINGNINVGNNDYKVVANTANGFFDDWVTINYAPSWGPFDDSVIGQSYELTDDDLLKDGDALPPIPLDRLEDAYAPAFILPVEGELNRGTSAIPFRLHYKSDKQDYLRSVYAFDNKDLHADPDIWVVYLLNGFQGTLVEDGDGLEDTGAIAGQADSDPGTGMHGMGAVIFQESGRELGDSNKEALGWRLKDAPPHELGHLFGGDHADDGLMFDPGDPRNTGKPNAKSEDFGSKTLDRMRARSNP